MKFCQFIILMIIIENIVCDCDRSNEKLLKEDYSVDNCKSANKGDGYCCYYETPKSTPTKGCKSITKYQYDHIDVVVEGWKTFGGDKGETEDKDVKIDCNSLNLKICSFLLILLILL